MPLSIASSQLSSSSSRYFPAGRGVLSSASDLQAVRVAADVRGGIGARTMVDDWDQIRALLKQIRPEDRHAIRSWLSEGLAFGEEHSREVRKGISEHSYEAVRMSELLEPLLWNSKDLDRVRMMLNGMDL